MNTREIGKSGLHVSSLAFGGNVFGWTIDEPTSFRLLDAFVDAGFNLIDTANVYSRLVPGHAGGESETIIGRWLRLSGKRDKVLIATKLGTEIGAGEAGLSRPYVARAVEASLKRQQSDRIDHYLSVAQGRPRHAAGGDARRVCRPDPPGQGPGDRGVELLRRAPRGGAGDQQGEQSAEVQVPPAAL
jgi:aryl-alcohol dehydrogenase-like predicted oxidoreductase